MIVIQNNGTLSLSIKLQPLTGALVKGTYLYPLYFNKFKS